MEFERALKNIGDWISKETELRKYPKGELLELSESLQALKATIARQSVTSEEVAEAISHIQGGYGDIWQWPKKRRDTIIAALQEYQPWIPVGERLPTFADADIDGTVLVSREDKRIDFCKWEDVRKEDYKGRKNTHWKPLPEPPKGE